MYLTRSRQKKYKKIHPESYKKITPYGRKSVTKLCSSALLHFSRARRVSRSEVQCVLRISLIHSVHQSGQEKFNVDSRCSVQLEKRAMELSRRKSRHLLYRTEQRRFETTRFPLITQLALSYSPSHLIVSSIRSWSLDKLEEDKREVIHKIRSYEE